MTIALGIFKTASEWWSSQWEFSGQLLVITTNGIAASRDGLFASSAPVGLAYGVDGIGVLRSLVGPIALDAREAQRQSAKIMGTSLQVIESDLHDQFWSYVNNVIFAREFELQAPRPYILSTERASA
jgi:hypothetical protein